jgi:hypothetical protein
MKRAMSWLVLLLLLVPFIQAQQKTNVSSYDKKDLENVVNLYEFKKAIEHYTRTNFFFTDAQKEMLRKNRFVVIPSNAEQFFHIYEGEHYGIEKPRVPNFITTDSVLHLFHLFYDFTLRAIEVGQLLPYCEYLTEGLLKGSLQQYEIINDPFLKDACLKNISYFGVASRLLEMEYIELPKACIAETEEELNKILNHEGRQESSIFPFEHDYSQYIPRGHYTRSEELTRFFLVMMWYGTNSFPFEFGEIRTEQQVLQALLINQLLQNTKKWDRLLIEFWERLYSITSLYVGPTDDLNPHDYQGLMDEVYGKEATVDVLSDKKLLNLLYEKSKKLPEPKIVQDLMGIPSGRQFRLFGQRFIPDSYIMQSLVKWPDRPWPMGLDVMAVLGSVRAAYLLDYLYNEPDKWHEYKPKRTQLSKEFASLGEDDWYTNIVSGWLYTIKALLEERDNNYPGFMQNSAWTDKELNTALASWVELRHDVILYAKPSGAEGGNGRPEKIPQPKGYVEPVPDFFRRLIKLMNIQLEILDYHDFLHKDLHDLFQRFLNLMFYLENIARKELRGEQLSFDEYERIRYFGKEIESLSLSILSIDRSLPVYNRTEKGYVYVKKGIQNRKLKAWYEVSGPDKDIACIVDVHTSLGECLEEAVGHLNTIYVIVPIDGKPYLTRGGVFSYYEFKYPAAHKLDDEAWQEMIKRGRAPEPPEWTSSFIVK